MFKILLFFASLKDFSFNQLLDTLITLKQKAYCRTSHSKIIVCIAVSNLPSKTPSPLFLVNPPPPILISANCPI